MSCRGVMRGVDSFAPRLELTSFSCIVLVWDFQHRLLRRFRPLRLRRPILLYCWANRRRFSRNRRRRLVLASTGLSKVPPWACLLQIPPRRIFCRPALLRGHDGRRRRECHAGSRCRSTQTRGQRSQLRALRLLGSCGASVHDGAPEVLVWAMQGISS
jgi:hypothetical protein